VPGWQSALSICDTWRIRVLTAVEICKVCDEEYYKTQKSMTKSAPMLH